MTKKESEATFNRTKCRGRPSQWQPLEITTKLVPNTYIASASACRSFISPITFESAYFTTEPQGCLENSTIELTPSIFKFRRHRVNACHCHHACLQSVPVPGMLSPFGSRGIPNHEIRIMVPTIQGSVEPFMDDGIMPFHLPKLCIPRSRQMQKRP